MRVLFISEYWHPFEKGGGEISSLNIAKELSKRGIEVHILTSYFKGLNKEERINKNLFIHRRLKTGKSPRSFFSNIFRLLFFPTTVKRETKKILKEHDFDLIHYFNMSSSLGVIDIQIPKILHVNSPYFFCPKGNLFYRDKIPCRYVCNKSIFSKCIKQSRSIGKMKNRLISSFFFKKFLYSLYLKKQKILKKMDYYFAVSEFIKKRLCLQGIDDKKIMVIPNVININKFTFNNKLSKKLKLIYVGEYTSFKGVYVALNALKELKIDYSCNFYGGGNEKENMISFVKNNKLSSKIKINNKVQYNKIIKLVENHNILLFPTIIPEAFGRVAIEAMAGGCLVIGSNTGGIPSIIKDNKTGFLFKPGDYMELRTKIEEISKNHKKFYEITREAHKQIKEYSPEKITKKIIKTYKNILKDESIHTTTQT